MYMKLASNCTTLHLSAPGASEKDRLAEEEEAIAELVRKGRLNQEPSDSWKVRIFLAFFCAPSGSICERTIFPSYSVVLFKVNTVAFDIHPLILSHPTLRAGSEKSYRILIRSYLNGRWPT
jgi:hypothetical protein